LPIPEASKAFSADAENRSREENAPSALETPA
jgi:hypothetical protein